MTDDVVTIIRHMVDGTVAVHQRTPLEHAALQAADEIDRLRELAGRWQATAAGLSQDISNAEDEIAQLKEILDRHGFGVDCGSYDCRCSTCDTANCECGEVRCD